ncbi:TauD/TfdA family dioxygenase [Streptomyces sp. NPDC090025]|uniref:TauD/TfdA family dioxygenase n=1 Tax=Streptomyces sp. NPDC090025 TaxID=3365922 RepID=UPI0038323E9D
MTELRRTAGPSAWCAAAPEPEGWLLPVDRATRATRAPVDGALLDDDLLDDALVVAADHALWHGAGFAVLRGLDLAGLTDGACVELCARITGRVGGAAGLRLQRSAHELLTARTAPAVPRPPGPGAPDTAPRDGDDLTLRPHMDRGEGPRPPRLLALLCVRPAAEGGESLLASGPALYDRLAAERPDVLRELGRDFRFGRGPGFDRVRPVFRLDGGTLTVHYNRYWVLRGQEETGRPFDEGRRDALRALDGLLRDPALVLRLPLRRGDLLLVNNSAVLHGRTPFKDGGAPGSGRCYARVWAD